LIETGLPGDSLIAAGFGEHHPVGPNDTDEQRAQNRRVEISAVPRPESFRARAARARSVP
jgi:flagellar motor protein MotB